MSDLTKIIAYSWLATFCLSSILAFISIRRGTFDEGTVLFDEGWFYCKTSIVGLVIMYISLTCEAFS